MDKGRWSILLVIFFLVQCVGPPNLLSFENNPLNPPAKANTGSPYPCFKNIYDAVCFGLLYYELDTGKECAKDVIARDYPDILLNSEVQFDLANMDAGRKGWTRYYPFSVWDKNFVMRIFLTEERSYQPIVPVLYEGSIKNPPVTFQILPSLNEILSGCKIKPTRAYSTRQVDSSA